MALTSSKMGLRIWNKLSDLFDHAQLANNFSKIDFHDHSPGRGVLIPTEGLADALITHAKLGSDVAGAFTSWRNNRTGFSGTVGAAVAAGTYLLGQAQETAVTALPTADARVPFYIDPADFAVTGRTTQFRLRGNVFVGGTAPATNFTIALFPVSTWTTGSASALGAAALTVPVFTAPGSNTRNTNVSPAGTLTAGWYVLGVTTAGATAASSLTTVQADLQVRFN